MGKITEAPIKSSKTFEETIIRKLDMLIDSLKFLTAVVAKKNGYHNVVAALDKEHNERMALTNDNEVEHGGE